MSPLPCLNQFDPIDLKWKSEGMDQRRTMSPSPPGGRTYPTNCDTDHDED